MALSDMYNEMVEAGSPYAWEKRRQTSKMGEYELESKRRALEAEQQLRDLYAKNPNPSFGAAAAIDPAFAQKMQSEQLKQLETQLGMQKTAAETAKLGTEEHATKAKIFANALGPLAEQFAAGGNPGEWKARVGATLANIEKMYNIKPDVNFEDFSPAQVLEASEGFGYPSARMKQRMAQQEAYGQQYGRAMAPVPAGVEMTPQGPMKRPGLPSGMVGSMNGFQPASAEDLPMLQQEYAATADVNRKQILGAMINEINQKSQFVTPEQASEIRVKEEKAKEVAKQEVQEKGASKKATMAYEMLPEPDRIRNLIKGSISGDAEYWANRLGGVVGKSLEAGDMTGALKVIEGQMADTVAMFPGAQSDKELEARMKTIGNPSGEISADTRLKAFDEWLNRMQKYAAQHAEYDDNQLVDMVKVGKLTADQALQVRKRRMSGGL